MSEWIEIDRDEKHIARERRKARELRQSNWWKEQLARGVCYYCRRKFPPEALTMDHIVPVVRGGKSTRGNVVACCKECNNRKKYLTPAELLLRQLEQDAATAGDSADDLQA
ncbi:HNH endonuclease [Victivallis sp. Marseille-Q1083]|uniref:HNH endonuclease n=1 Tax=Victivallis sp. Marseille-Q1083 TaxID=2717288 RepID=UPI0015897D2D|nr:HNH endonuclease [Victivallis sp. Marseille-Q1083]